jgi:4-hydroxy-tetrahydrodipicolinate reductase
MNIILSGYGKMGKEIETIAIKRNHNIILKINKSNCDSVSDEDLKKADAIIEFSTPHTVIDNLKKYLNTQVPVVVGTTGWYTNFEEIKEFCLKKNGALFHATNFSVGVNLFFKVNTYLADIMNKYENYDVSLEEIHHIHKLDKPSGTAITLAEQIIKKLDRKKSWSINEKNIDTLFINDIRDGEVPGTHIIKYHSEIDDIEIMHKAHNRKGFALGAIIAAEFMLNKKGIYTMNDLI